jgi:hypothetical protein
MFKNDMAEMRQNFDLRSILSLVLKDLKNDMRQVLAKG